MRDEVKVFKSGPLESAIGEKSKLWMGIDQSLTGFAVCILDANGEYYIEVYRPATRGTRRLVDIQQFLKHHVQRWSPEDIAMEATVLRSTSASILGELSGAVKLALYPTTPLIIPPTTLKKFVTGSGNAQKNQMMMNTLKRYKVEIPDDNAVDAYGLARIVRGTSITKVEEQIITKLSDPKFRE